MNTIPLWVFILIALAGFGFTMFFAKKKKSTPALFGVIVCIAGVALFLSGRYGAFKPDPIKAEFNGWYAEAYGVAQYVKKAYPGEKIAVFGWLPGNNEGIEAYMKELEAEGVDASYIAVSSFPPIGMTLDKQMELLSEAIDKAGNAKIFVYRNAVLPREYLDSEAYGEDFRFIQTSYDADKDLWHEGVVVATVKSNGTDLSTLSMSSAKAAYEKGFTTRENSYRAE